MRIMMSSLQAPRPAGSVAHRGRPLLAYQLARAEPAEPERLDDLRDAAGGDARRHGLPGDRARLEPVGAPADVHVEALHLGAAHDGGEVRGHVAKPAPLA